MAYLVEYSRDSAKFIKKAGKNKPMSEHLKAVNRQLEEDYSGLAAEQLSGSLNFLSCHHFKINRVDYRLVFSVNKADQSIFVWLIGTRQNFYKELLRKLG